jgi:hypothetical protein
MRNLSNFERKQIVGTPLAAASVTKSATLLDVSTATVSKVMSVVYTDHATKISAKRNSGRTSTLTVKDCRTLRRIVSKNHMTTAAQVTG